MTRYRHSEAPSRVRLLHRVSEKKVRSIGRNGGPHVQYFPGL